MLQASDSLAIGGGDATVQKLQFRNKLSILFIKIVCFGNHAVVGFEFDVHSRRCVLYIWVPNLIARRNMILKLQRHILHSSHSTPAFRVYGKSIGQAWYHRFDKRISINELKTQIHQKERIHNPNVDIRLHMKINGHWVQLSPDSIVAEDQKFIPYYICLQGNY